MPRSLVTASGPRHEYERDDYPRGTSESIKNMNDEIIKDEDRLSICCGAPLYSDTDICSDCKEHSGVDEEYEEE